MSPAVPTLVDDSALMDDRDGTTGRIQLVIRSEDPVDPVRPFVAEAGPSQSARAQDGDQDEKRAAAGRERTHRVSLGGTPPI
jgi:hypothetical protein